MNKKALLSVVISAYNEEKKLGDCLDSVSFADEVIVIDNESTDATAEIAKKHGATVIKRKNNLMLNVNKNFGFTKAKHEWILSLDADERIPEELAIEIAQTIENKDALQGYWISRRNIIFGKWIKHTGWYPDYVLRLFKKKSGKFEERHVHEMIKLEGEAGHLSSDMVHLNYETIAQFLHKTIVIYAPNEAAELLRNGYKLTFSDAFRFPLNEFLSRYFLREGYRDGFHGLMLSLLMAAYHFIVYANIWELKGFKQIEVDDMLISTEQEFAKGYKDTMYWVYSEKIKVTRNGLKKTVFKVLRKI